jgi:NADH-quinone oxidoreductase subunit L
MTIPLVILALLSIVGGFHFFAHVFLPLPSHGNANSTTVAALAFTAMLAGSAVGFVLYKGRESEPLNVTALRRRLYFDEFYDWLIKQTQTRLSRISAFIDRWIIDLGAVRGVSGATWGFGAVLRLLQVGNLQAYAFLFGLGIIGLLYFTIFR